MNFSEKLMKEQGHGLYKYITPPTMPKFFLAYLGNPSDSGKIHSDVALRYSKGFYLFMKY